MKKKIMYIALIVFISIFLISGGLLIKDLLRSKKEKSANEKLVQIVHKAKEEISKGNNIATKSGILYQYDKIYKKNNDMIGWIYIEGTNIDYPVMYKENDPEYYLRRGFDKKYAYSGSIFAGEGYSKEKNYVIIYGHNMKDESMFGTLNKYKTKKFAMEHPIIHFDTLTTENEYEIVGAFYSEIYDENKKDVFKYYEYDDLSNKDTFNEFMNKVKENTLYNTGVEAEYGDKIIILSTCSYHTDNGRFAVIAKEKK